jgi:hypothetical protein
VRSGPAFGRPSQRILDVVQYTTMFHAFQDELLERYNTQPTDPRVRAKQLSMTKKLIELYPEVLVDVRLEGERKGVRWALRDVLAGRGLATSTEDEARIDACTDLITLRRWLFAAVTAANAAEALR